MGVDDGPDLSALEGVQDPDEVPTQGFRIEDLEGPMAQVLLAELERLDALDAERAANPSETDSLTAPRTTSPFGPDFQGGRFVEPIDEFTLDDRPAELERFRIDPRLLAMGAGFVVMMGALIAWSLWV